MFGVDMMSPSFRKIQAIDQFSAFQTLFSFL